jgi:hypothetical protein
MTNQQEIIIRQLEHLLAKASTDKRREAIKKQIADFRAACEPKPKPTRPKWVDEF